MGASFTPQRRSNRRRGFKPNSEINVTPLVDVMLVLLIIFMVTAPILTVGVPVDLPKTTATQTNDTVEPVVISMNKDGKTFLKDQEMTMPEIITRLQLMAQDNPDQKVYVRGDKHLNYGQIMEVMGIIASAGFQKVSLIAEMPNESAAVQVNKISHQKITSKKS